MPEISRKAMDKYAKVLQLFLGSTEEGEREAAQQRLAEMEAKYPGVGAAVEKELEAEAARRKQQASPGTRTESRAKPGVSTFFDDLLAAIASQAGFSDVINQINRGEYLEALLNAAKAVNSGMRKEASEIDRVLNTVAKNAEKGIAIQAGQQGKSVVLQVEVKQSYLQWLSQTAEKRPDMAEQIQIVFAQCLQEAFSELAGATFFPDDDEDMEDEEDEDDLEEEDSD